MFLFNIRANIYTRPVGDAVDRQFTVTVYIRNIFVSNTFTTIDNVVGFICRAPSHTQIDDVTTALVLRHVVNYKNSPYNDTRTQYDQVECYINKRERDED